MPIGSKRKVHEVGKHDLSSKSKNQQGGFGLVETLLAVAASSVLGLTVASMMVQANKLQQRATFFSNVSDLRTQLSNTIQDPIAWANTINNNPSMACLLKGSSCLGQQQVQFIKIFDASNNLVYDASNPNSGFTQSGSACTGFNQGDASCVLHVNLVWHAICNLPQDPSCLLPRVQVNGTITYSGPNYEPSVFSNYNFTIQNFGTVASASGITLQQACVGLGGTYTVKTRKCSLPTTISPGASVACADTSSAAHQGHNHDPDGNGGGTH